MKKDFELIESIANDNLIAFNAFYNSYSEQIYNTSLSFTGNKEEAEEITQDVFVKIYRSAKKFKGQSSVATWVYRITVNTALNYINRSKRLRVLQFQFEPKTINFNHPGVDLERKEEAEILYAVIEDLPSNQKTAFVLSYIEDLPRQEVADIMNTSLKAVESLLQRAKQSIRKKIEKKYPKRRI